MRRRYLLKALNPDLAYEVEKEGIINYLEIIKFVRKAEQLFNKYKKDKNSKKKWIKWIKMIY
jgi:hypothetical protein